MVEKIRVSTEIEVTLKVIGGKWKPLILHYLQCEGPRRYMDILRFVENAPKKTLTAQLRELEEDGILSWTVIPAVPVQVEYAVTPLGKTLYPVLDAMCDWGYTHLGDRYELTHATCTESDD